MWTALIFSSAVLETSFACLSVFNGRALLNNFSRRLGKAAVDDSKDEIPLINVPGQRFTATHGIKAQKGEQKLFLFNIPEGAPANYAAISANMAVAGTQGGHDRYSMYMRYGVPPTPREYDVRSVVTVADSYVGDKLYSQDIRIERPAPGSYFLLIVAHKPFYELLVTAIVDTPPDPKEVGFARRGPGFTIQRMGQPQ